MNTNSDENEIFEVMEFEDSNLWSYQVHKGTGQNDDLWIRFNQMSVTITGVNFSRTIDVNTINKLRMILEMIGSHGPGNVTPKMVATALKEK